MIIGEDFSPIIIPIRGVNILIYLDNAATTFPKPEIVYKTMDNYMRNKCVNAGRGSYKLAREAVEMIEETRELIRDLVHLNTKDKVIFTSSATIAINQILNGLDWSKIKHVFVTPFEHNAIMRTLHHLKKSFNFDITIIPFNSETFEIETSRAKVLFAENKPELVLMSHVSNVTGYILPVHEILKLSKEYNENVITVIDAAQSLGVVDINMTVLGCDFIVFAGHKSLYGPFGIAGFIKSDKVTLKNYIVGGTGSDSTNLEITEDSYGKYEVGSYNTYAISGLNASLKWIKEIGIKNIYSHKKILTDKLVDILEQIDKIQIYIPKNREKHIGVVSLTVDGFENNEVGSILNDEFDIAIRTGHHCAPFISRFFEGDSLKDYESCNECGNGTVRVSIGYFNTDEDIEKFNEAILDIVGD